MGTSLLKQQLPGLPMTFELTLEVDILQTLIARMPVQCAQW